MFEKITDSETLLAIMARVDSVYQQEKWEVKLLLVQCCLLGLLLDRRVPENKTGLNIPKTLTSVK